MFPVIARIVRERTTLYTRREYPLRRSGAHSHPLRSASPRPTAPDAQKRQGGEPPANNHLLVLMRLGSVGRTYVGEPANAHRSSSRARVGHGCTQLYCSHCRSYGRLALIDQRNLNYRTAPRSDFDYRGLSLAAQRRGMCCEPTGDAWSSSGHRTAHFSNLLARSLKAVTGTLQCAVAADETALFLATGPEQQASTGAIQQAGVVAAPPAHRGPSLDAS